MAQNKGPKDDKLIQDLYEKLNWFTFQASDEEFDEEQVRAILELLDKLDPMPKSEGNAGGAFLMQEKLQESEGDAAGNSPDREEKLPKQVFSDDPAAAFERFKKKYNITDEDLARKDGKLAESGDSADDGRIVPFPDEFSEEIAFDGPQVREKLVQREMNGGQAYDEKGDGAADADAERKDAKNSGIAANGEESKKRRGHILDSAWGKVAAAVIVVAAAGTYLSFGTSAVQQKSFFEIVQDGVNSIKFTVTGNVVESESETEDELERGGQDAVYYDSWEEAAEENSDILIPGYIPEGLELEEIYKRDYSNYMVYTGLYTSEKKDGVLTIRVKCFRGNYLEAEIINENQWTLIDINEEEKIRYYQWDEYYLALWEKNNCIYTVKWVDLKEINEIIDQIKE